MKTVGILTFIETVNYGALLQAYSLQEVIQSYGMKAEILQYVNEDIRKKEMNEKTKKDYKYFIKKLVMGKALLRKRDKFKLFEENNIKKGMDIIDEALFDVNERYDFFVTGSDQVWNMNITKNDWTFFLDFVKDSRKLISYAPSFGNEEFPLECRNKISELLNRFRALSVREQSGKELIYDISRRESQVVLDPTLLLDKNKWNKMANFKPPLAHYILVYFPNNKKVVFDFVKKLKKETKLPVVYLSISPRIQFGVKTIYDASVEEFLGWIKHADYVVTGSFHGTAFSLNFEKQFFYEPSGIGSRIDNIVKLCGVEERAIGHDQLKEPIDYKEVSRKLDELRKESYFWLKNAFFD